MLKLNSPETPVGVPTGFYKFSPSNILPLESGRYKAIFKFHPYFQVQWEFE